MNLSALERLLEFERARAVRESKNKSYGKGKEEREYQPDDRKGYQHYLKQKSLIKRRG